MSKVQGFRKDIAATTLHLWRRDREKLELAWDGKDVLLYLNDKYLRRITDTPAVQIEVWDSEKTYLAGDNFVSYKSPDYQYLSEDDPFSEEYIYRCVENTNPGESPESHPDKWSRQGKVGQVGGDTIFLSDVSGLEEALDDRIKYTDLSEEFNVSSNKRVSLDIDYITLSNFSGKDYIQPDTKPAAKINLSSTSIATVENDSITVEVTLEREPIDDVILSITSQDTDVATVTQSTLTFTPSNYDTPQNIEINGVSDDNSVTDSTSIKVEVDSSDDSNYNNLSPKYISVDVEDLDEANYILSKSTMNINEGDSGTFNVRLTAQPVSDVIVSISSEDNDIVTVDKSSLTFTDTDYDTNQTITVSAIDDTDVGDKTVNIVLSISSSDSSYDSLSNKNISVTSVDDDGLKSNEVKIGNTIWKTSSESWDDGGDGIFDDSEGYGKLYDYFAVKRLLDDNPDYRLPNYEDIKDLVQSYDSSLTWRVNNQSVTIESDSTEIKTFSNNDISDGFADDNEYNDSSLLSSIANDLNIPDKDFPFKHWNVNTIQYYTPDSSDPDADTVTLGRLTINPQEPRIDTEASIYNNMDSLKGQYVRLVKDI